MTNAEAIAALAAEAGLTDRVLGPGDECEIVFDGDLSVVLCGALAG